MMTQSLLATVSSLHWPGVQPGTARHGMLAYNAERHQYNSADLMTADLVSPGLEALQFMILQHSMYSFHTASTVFCCHNDAECDGTQARCMTKKTSTA